MKRTIIANPWHLSKDADVHTDVIATVELIRKSLQTRRRNEQAYWRLYNNGCSTGLESTDKLEASFNLIAQAVDTAASQIVRPYRPQFTTVEAEFQLQKTARKLTQVLEGQTEDLRLDEAMAALYVAGGVTGNGELFGWLDEENKIHIEVCPPGSTLVDPRDGSKGDPYNKYYLSAVPRESLLNDYPKLSTIIDEAASPTAKDRAELGLATDTTVDDVLVVYAFRRPTNSKSKDGRFCAVVSTGTLIDENWDEPLPFVGFNRKPRAGSYYGVGYAEAGFLAQARFNRYAERVEILESGPARTVVSDKRNKVRIGKLTSEDYSLVEYDGSEGVGPPQIESHQVVPTDLVSQQDRAREQFLSEQGISPFTAEGAKPAGLNSAVAQRTYRDITASRQKLEGEAFKRAYVDLFKLLLRLNRRAALSGEYKVQASTTRGRMSMVTEINWKEAELPENKYRIMCQPVSEIPDSAAGRQELVSEWIASGMTSRNFAQSLSQQSTLDVDATARLELADTDRTMYDLERIEDGFPAVPEPYLRGDIAYDIARRAYLVRSCQDVPEPILAQMRAYIDAALELAESQKPAEPQQPPTPEMQG